MRAWHDYHITAYTVDGANACISFELVWPYDTETDIKRATVIFSGVAGYFIEYDLGINIVFEFEERPLAESLERHADRFEHGRKWGWPIFWRGNAERTLENLREQKIRCFEISSSYGLNGCVFASDVAHQAS